MITLTKPPLLWRTGGPLATSVKEFVQVLGPRKSTQRECDEYNTIYDKSVFLTRCERPSIVWAMLNLIGDIFGTFFSAYRDRMMVESYYASCVASEARSRRRYKLYGGLRGLLQILSPNIRMLAAYVARRKIVIRANFQIYIKQYVTLKILVVYIIPFRFRYRSLYIFGRALSLYVSQNP